MIVSPEARVLFVHVQKTGGLTVESLLRESLPDAKVLTGLPNRHAPLAIALREHPEVADYWTFGFVRNPWARMYSWWSMIQRRKAVAAGGNEVVAARIARSRFWSGVIEKFPDFEAFLMKGPEEYRRLRTPQIDYLRTEDRQADFIGRTENFDADLRVVLERIGIPAPPEVPHKNRGPAGDYRQHYDDRTRDRVAELFAPDIEEFGYRF